MLARANNRAIHAVFESWAQPRWNAARQRIMITSGISGGLQLDHDAVAAVDIALRERA